MDQVSTVEHANLVPRRAYSEKFQGIWIDREIATDNQFSPPQKILLAEIFALEKNGGCWASNDHFAGLLSIGPRMVRNHISKLEEAGHLRSEDRNSKHRRLWIGDDLRNKIEGRGSQCVESRRSDTTATGQLASASGVIKAEATRQQISEKPGNDNHITEADRLLSRKQAATENTLRDQKSDTNEKSSEFGFSELPDWLPAHAWNCWLEHNRSMRRKISPLAVEAQLKQLEILSRDGHPPDLVIQHAIAGDYKTFYPLPAAEKPTNHSHRLKSGARVINGMLVR